MTTPVVLSSYAAKDCPVKVQYDRTDAKTGIDPLPQTAFSRMLTDGGIAFEKDVFAEILAKVDGVVDLSAEDRSIADLAAATVDAMGAGALVILGGALPIDVVGHRTGKPDVLVRAEQRGGKWRYLPVDVKDHAARSVPKKPKGKSVEQSALSAPLYELREEVEGLAPADKRKDDLLQLAHYYRMLQACGSDSEEVVGGIIGRERVVVWAALDEIMFQQTWDLSKVAKRSALDTYDFEFGFRLDVVDRWNDSQELLQPVKVEQCGSCKWWSACGPALIEADSTSLVPGIGYVQWKILDKVGIRTRRDLAGLNPHLAAVQKKMGGELLEWFHATAGLPPESSLAGVTGPGRKAPWWQKGTAAFAEVGVHTVGDLRTEMSIFADMTGVAEGAIGEKPVVSGWGMGVKGPLTTAIWKARIALDGAPDLAYRWAGVELVEVQSPGYDVDFDMEKLEDTVYLWGARTPDGEYRPVVNWSADQVEACAGVFLQFWEWMHDLIEDTHTSERPVRFWGWHLVAEKTALKEGNRAAVAFGERDREAEIEAFTESEHWCDLKKVFDAQLLTPYGSGLKEIAPLAGFTWADDEAGGDNSMAWYLQAIDETDAEHEAMRARLLTYNEDDVVATATVRQWMRETTFPSVTSLDGRPNPV